MNNVIEYYSNFDEWGRLEREPIEFIINWHYIRQYLPISGHILDNGAGPGKYSIELAKHGYSVTLTDITPRLVNIAKEKANQLALTDKFSGFHVLNATNLDGILDETYDASLMLGPLYHLQTEHEREAAVRELHRVTKSDAVVFVAFQSRMRMLLTSLLYPQFWKPNDNMDSINTFLNSGIFNHNDKGRFTGAYYYDIEDIKPFMEKNGFETVDLIGSSNIGALLNNEQKQYWIEQGEKEKLIDLLIRISSDPSVLGVSSHLLYIGKKK
ncbi:class I SAM-dependent methyltransferase [Brevibacillus centrosporus]|uniref:Ubiquinone/menaquinone biosynthesis C-methylase UbiE n=1 Tax=Brevibacillus centrosporus TaxID=54910 RepID=A0A1I3WHX1_9BACL|nr:class I SAM-dependent methyltransferase [Brevibacillus centrosporus]MED4907448.1 class I SAM-dependent methyltransferase [Brevibacillus centrosporus]SFK07128.1 Ubiquinone/menaquinone biosynthesis C-methylase UbiE [Brevibacillus centrosporus]